LSQAQLDTVIAQLASAHADLSEVALSRIFQQVAQDAARAVRQDAEQMAGQVHLGDASTQALTWELDALLDGAAHAPEPLPEEGGAVLHPAGGAPVDMPFFGHMLGGESGQTPFAPWLYG
jgi:hypothetical protein